MLNVEVEVMGISDSDSLLVLVPTLICPELFSTTERKMEDGGVDMAEAIIFCTNPHAI